MELKEQLSVRARPLSEYSFLELQVWESVMDKLNHIAKIHSEKIYLDLGYTKHDLRKLENQSEEWAKLALELEKDLRKSLIKGFRSELMLQVIDKMIENANK